MAAIKKGAIGAKRAVILPVSAPFHCALMMPAQQRLERDLRAAKFCALKIPLITNVDAQAITTGDEARDALISQVTVPVRWLDSVREMIESGDGSAQLAYDVFIHRLRKYVGAYLAILGRTDVVSFTAGVGENAASIRQDALSGLQGLGIDIDEQRNSLPAKGARRISTDASKIAVLVVPTNEELAIARDCLRAI